MSAVAGVATFADLKIDHTGTGSGGYKLKFTSGSLTYDETSRFDVAVFARPGMVLKSTDSDPALADNTSVPGSGVGSVTYHYCTGFQGGTNCTQIGAPVTGGSPFALTWSTGVPAVGSKIRIVAVPKDRVENSAPSSPSDLGSAPSTPVYVVP